MGTHPIFESDFDCLTDRLNRISEKMSAELGCTYAALILNDDDVEITGDKITAILKDADVRSLITNIGSGVGSGPAAGGAAAAGGDAASAEAPKEEANKAESSSEEDDDMGFGLFD